MSQLDLIIFDCDGTLTDSEYLNNIAVVDLLNELGLKQYTLEYAYKHFVGRALGIIFDEVEAENGIKLPADLAQQYMRRVNEYQKTMLKPIEGALDFVKSMHGRLPMCVASNGERTNVVSSLQALGFMDYFTEDQVFTKTQVKRPKPYPDLFEFAASNMNAPDASRILVLEDSVAGVKAGRAAHMVVYGFTGVNHNPELARGLLRENGANEVFHSYNDVKTAVENCLVAVK